MFQQSEGNFKYVCLDWLYGFRLMLNRGGLTVMDSWIWLQYVGHFISGIYGIASIIMPNKRNKSYSLKGETAVATLELFFLLLKFSF